MLNTYQSALALLFAYAVCLMIFHGMKMAARAVKAIRIGRPKSIDERVSDLVSRLKKSDAQNAIAEQKLLMTKLKGLYA